MPTTYASGGSFCGLRGANPKNTTTISVQSCTAAWYSPQTSVPKAPRY
jgi:hypothetical protein